MKTPRIAALLFAVACGCAAAATPTPHPPNYAAEAASRKMSNVYLLAHAAAILDVCLSSPDAGAFPEAKTREIGELAGRLATLVRSIGTHYRDGELFAVYESTKANLAADTRLQFHVKKNHENCGDRTLGNMRTYVADNEALIGNFIEAKRQGAPAKK